MRFAASDDYTWAFDVNIVQITLGEARMELSTKDPFIVTGNTHLQVFSAPGGIRSHAIVVTQSIESMIGPTRFDNAQRGLEHMIVGFIQTGKMDPIDATYQGQDNVWRHQADGLTYIDLLSLGNESSKFPWYDVANKSSALISGKGVQLGRRFLGEDKGPYPIVIGDRPYPAIPLRGPGNNLLQSWNAVFSFDTNVAVATLDRTTEPDSTADNSVRQLYFIRSAGKWSFDGSGNVTDGITGAGTGIDIQMTEESEGRLALPDTVEDLNVLFNDAINAPNPWFPPQ